MKNFCYILETKQRPKSNSNSLANALGKLRFLAKPQKSSSNKLAKSLGKNPRLANSLPTGAYMRASVDLANRGFRPVACSPARANCETFSRGRQMNIDRANIYRDRSVPFLLVCQATRGEGRASQLPRRDGDGTPLLRCEDHRRREHRRYPRSRFISDCICLDPIS